MPDWWLNQSHGDVAANDSFPAVTLDCHKPTPIYRFKIPERGLVLWPGKLYLGATVERTASDTLVPLFDGRSSLARLGLSVHQTGGFGDLGFSGTWTVELSCVEPVRIYAGIEIGQLVVCTCKGDVDLLYSQKSTSKYNNQQAPTPSKIYQEQ